VLKQQPVDQLQEQHEATKIKASKTKHMKLCIREYDKWKIPKDINTKYKKSKLKN
jgi:hypothetical protein